jgi:exosortase A-associated hydrolase 2
VSFPEVFFLPARQGRRFCVRYTPPTRAIGAIVFVPPFAEEMNKARRMAALQARALAETGWTVLQMDLFGCGDSDGDFAEADWMQWRTDIADAAEWLRDQTECVPMLWGLRAGCLLACDAARDMSTPPNLLFWQPSISGRQTLQQFLRLRVAGQLLGSPSSGKIGTTDLYEQLLRGESVEVAGYTLSSSVALGLDATQLTPPATPARVAWLDIAPAVSADPSPAVRGCIAAWEALGHKVKWQSVAGPSFWQTQEIGECAELIEATLQAVGKGDA